MDIGQPQLVPKTGQFLSTPFKDNFLAISIGPSTKLKETNERPWRVKPLTMTCEMELPA